MSMPVLIWLQFVKSTSTKGCLQDPRVEKVVYLVLRKSDQYPIGLAGLRIDRQNGNSEIILVLGKRNAFSRLWC